MRGRSRVVNRATIRVTGGGDDGRVKLRLGSRRGRRQSGLVLLLLAEKFGEEGRLLARGRRRSVGWGGRVRGRGRLEVSFDVNGKDFDGEGKAADRAVFFGFCGLIEDGNSGELRGGRKLRLRLALLLVEFILEPFGDLRVRFFLGLFIQIVE